MLVVELFILLAGTPEGSGVSFVPTKELADTTAAEEWRGADETEAIVTWETTGSDDEWAEMDVWFDTCVTHCETEGVSVIRGADFGSFSPRACNWEHGRAVPFTTSDSLLPSGVSLDEEFPCKNTIN